jgi:hypothetical protein
MQQLLNRVTDDFERDDAFQRRKRDELLVPYYRATYGGFLLLDEGPFARQMQRRGVDTLVWLDASEPIAIEEKIVRYKGRKYECICLETESCTTPGHIARGWMWYSMADLLLYCLEDAEGDLDCYAIDFPVLYRWFWPREKEFHLHVMPDTVNLTASRIVPIDLIEANVPVHHFYLTKSGGGP